MGFDQAEKETTIEDIHKHVVHTPYREYPRHVHKAGGLSLIVEDEKGKTAALKAGWSLTPVLPEEPKAKDASAPDTK